VGSIFQIYRFYDYFYLKFYTQIMAVFQKFHQFSLDLGKGVHNFSTNQLKVALTAVAPLPSAHLLADITEISYTNLSSRNVTTTSWTQVSGLSKLIVAALTLSASGGSVAGFRYVVLYNDTAASDPLIGFWDYGSLITLADGQSEILTPDPTNGIIQLS
jgi:hypothetical protein